MQAAQGQAASPEAGLCGRRGDHASADLVESLIACAQAVQHFRKAPSGADVAAAAACAAASCAALCGPVALGSCPDELVDVVATVRATLSAAALAAAGPPSSSDLAGARPQNTLERSAWAPAVLGPTLTSEGGHNLVVAATLLSFVEAGQRSLPAMDRLASAIRQDVSIGLSAALALGSTEPGAARVPGAMPAGKTVARRRKGPTAKGGLPSSDASQVTEVAAPSSDGSASGPAGAAAGDAPMHPDAPSWVRRLAEACTDNFEAVRAAAHRLELDPYLAPTGSARALRLYFESSPAVGGPPQPPEVAPASRLLCRCRRSTSRTAAERWAFGRAAYRMETDVSGLLAPLLAFLLALLASAVDARVTQVWWAVETGAALLAEAAFGSPGDGGAVWAVTVARTAAASFWAVVLSLSAAAVLLPIVGQAVAERFQAPGSPVQLVREATLDTPLFRIFIPEGACVTGRAIVDDSRLSGDRIYKPPAALSSAVISAAAAARAAGIHAGSTEETDSGVGSAGEAAGSLSGVAAEASGDAAGISAAGDAGATEAGPTDADAHEAAAGLGAASEAAAAASAAGGMAAAAAAGRAEFPVPKDLLPVLREAATELRAAGLEEEALRAESNAAWIEAQVASTASE